MYSLQSPKSKKSKKNQTDTHGQTKILQIRGNQGNLKHSGHNEEKNPQKQIKLLTSKYKPIVLVVGPHNWFVFILPKIVTFLRGSFFFHS